MLKYRANQRSPVAERVTGVLPLWATCAKAFSERWGDWLCLGEAPSSQGLEAYLMPALLIRRSFHVERVWRSRATTHASSLHDSVVY